MKTVQRKSNKGRWTPQKYEAFGAELDAVHEEAKAKMGPEDIAHVERMRRISRAMEIIGRSLIQVSFDPLTWSAGVFSLALHHQLETTEIGHSALHGAWDVVGAKGKWSSANFRWETPVEEESWKREHNILHHQYTNIVGHDPDLNYGPLRVTEKTKWIPYHLVQLSQFFWTAPLFIWMIAVHATGLTDISHPTTDPTYAPVLPERSLKAFGKAFLKTAKKMVPYSLYEFVFWPALAGPLWWKVLGGNAAADVLRNIYTCATIYAGHFGEDLIYQDIDYRPKGRGEWYKMQIEASHDYRVPHAISLLCGALDYQIEHHLFPKLPPNRLREIGPKVEEICRRYGVQYQKTTWGRNLGAALKRLAKMSPPPALSGLMNRIALPKAVTRLVPFLKAA